MRKGRKGGGRESRREGTGGGEGREKGERHTVEQTCCRIGAAQFSAGDHSGPEASGGVRDQRIRTLALPVGAWVQS